MTKHKITSLIVFLLAIGVAAWEMTSAQRTPEHSQKSRKAAGDKAGDFDYYALVLSWSPTYCATTETPQRDPQCNGSSGRPYAFVLHGLWPQYERGYPERCWTKDRPFVPKSLIKSMLDIMPSPKLVIHEYKKHGTCSGLKPYGYYALSRQLFEKITIPTRYVRPNKPQTVTPKQLENEFIEFNPELKHDMIAVSCKRQRNRLNEIRICFTKNGKLRQCGSNENQRRLCRARSLYVPPVR